MRGGLGNDTYVVENALDQVIELASEGTDSVESAITYTLPTHVDNLRLVTAGAINGHGNGADNQIFGNESANTLTGGGGNDVLSGGKGDDIYRRGHR